MISQKSLFNTDVSGGSMADVQKKNETAYVPLAAKIRPQTLDEFVGQSHLVGKNSPIRKLIETENITSMIFWGPPGCGKTTLAEIIANQTKSKFFTLSAVNAGKADVKEIVKIYGFSRNRVIQPTEEDPADEIRRDFRKKYGRKAFTFPDQVLS